MFGRECVARFKLLITIVLVILQGCLGSDEVSVRNIFQVLNIIQVLILVWNTFFGEQRADWNKKYNDCEIGCEITYHMPFVSHSFLYFFYNVL